MLIFSISFPVIKFPDFMDIPQRRVWGWKEAQRQGDFANNFSYTYMTQNIDTGRASVFDKCLHWPRVSVKIYIYTATR
jgi:hypothetical protein